MIADLAACNAWLGGSGGEAPALSSSSPAKSPANRNAAIPSTMDEVLFIGMSSKTITDKHATAFAAHGPRWAKPQRSISAADSILGRQINGLWHGDLRQAHGNQQTAHGKDGIGNGK